MKQHIPMKMMKLSEWMMEVTVTFPYSSKTFTSAKTDITVATTQHILNQVYCKLKGMGCYF
jgi:hypothetical protein